MVNAITTFISNFFAGLIIKLVNLFISFAQDGYNGMIDFMVSVVGLFPDGPPLPSMLETPGGASFAMFLQGLNWLFPMSYMVSMLEWVASGYILFLFIAPLARFFKLVT